MIGGRMCVASNNFSTELLRTQLDHLHSEADFTRRKANNARFRLLRLSEAADNLCRQAAKSVQMGKENDARDLLVQKKKIMIALEKSKGRIELLDELAAKLNEAITIKEAQLVENVASDLEIDGDDNCRPVHIVSPTPGSMENLNDPDGVSLNYSNFDEVHEPKPVEDQELNSDEDLRLEERFNTARKTAPASELGGLSLYIDFLKDLDQQLNEIEEDLMAILDASTLELVNEEEPSRSGLQKISKTLQNIRDTRLRIHNYMVENMAAS